MNFTRSKTHLVEKNIFSKQYNAQISGLKQYNAQISGKGVDRLAYAM